jgi:hypothetical protein
MDLREIGWGVWSGFTWLRIGIAGGLLWMRWWTFGFWCHGVSWVSVSTRYGFPTAAEPHEIPSSGFSRLQMLSWTQTSPPGTATLKTVLKSVCLFSCTVYMAYILPRHVWAGFQFLRSASMKMTVFWVVAPSSLVDVYRLSEVPAASVLRWC